MSCIWVQVLKIYGQQGQVYVQQKKALGDSIGKKDTSNSVIETSKSQGDIAFQVLIGALIIIGGLETVIGLLKSRYDSRRVDRTSAEGANGNSNSTSFPPAPHVCWKLNLFFQLQVHLFCKLGSLNLHLIGNRKLNFSYSNIV